MRVDQINTSKILPPKFDQRTLPNEEADNELLESIKQWGVLEPILVKQDVNQYEIIFGHRRFRMAVRAGLPSIPCIIFKAGDRETEILKFHENLHRLPLSHIDQGNTFLYLRETFKMSESEISLLVKKSVPYISQHLTLVRSDPDIIEAVNKDEITFSAARELNQVQNEKERKRLLDVVRENGATVPVIQSWVREANRPAQGPDSEPVYVPNGGIPPYSTIPTFPCEACNNVHPIGEMKIVRLCPQCDFNFRNAIFAIHKEKQEKNANVAP